MKTKIYLFKLLMLLTPIWVGATVNPDSCTSHELKKMVVKEYSVNKSTRLEVSNKYGKIETSVWDKASVKIVCTVITRSGNKSTAQDKLDNIQIDISESGNVISAVTSIQSKSTGWFSGWFSGMSSAEMEINYMVHMPDYIDIRFENKYGNIYLQDLKSKTDIILKYGNMEANNIDNNMNLTLAYGKATAGIVRDLTAQLAYSDYRGVKADKVNVTTKYSKFYLDQAQDVVADSKYDSYKLGTVMSLVNTGAYDDMKIKSVNNAEIKTKYSGVEILSLGQNLNMDISYGSVMIEDLKTSCKNIEINTKYAPVKIYGVIPSRVEIEGKYFEARLGTDFIEKTRVDDRQYKQIKGYKISEKGSTLIRINTSYGDVYMK